MGKRCFNFVPLWIIPSFISVTPLTWMLSNLRPLRPWWLSDLLKCFFQWCFNTGPPKKVMLTVVSKMGMGQKPDTPDTSQKPDARARVHRSDHQQEFVSRFRIRRIYAILAPFPLLGCITPLIRKTSAEWAVALIALLIDCYQGLYYQVYCGSWTDSLYGNPYPFQTIRKSPSPLTVNPPHPGETPDIPSWSSWIPKFPSWIRTFS